MKIQILVDNNTLIGKYYLGESGASYYIEEAGKKYLLDTGYSNIFLQNAKALKVDLSKLNAIVISHGHDDHTRGLTFLPENFFALRKHKPELIAHPSIFETRRNNGIDFGCPLTKETCATLFSLRLTKEPYWLSKQLVFLGEIPRINDFEAKQPLGKVLIGDSWHDDYVLDDSALVYCTSNGLVIITGCSHSGICNIMSYAQTVCGDSRIISVLGGFHLHHAGPGRMESTLEYLSGLHLESAYACHCTDLEAKIYLAQKIPIREVGVGQVLEFA